jgi:hypothetical protein
MCAQHTCSTQKRGQQAIIAGAAFCLSLYRLLLILGKKSRFDDVVFPSIYHGFAICLSLDYSDHKYFR